MACTAEEKALPQRFPQFYYSILVGLSGVVIGTAFAWNSAAARLTRKFGDNDHTTTDHSMTDLGWYLDPVACYFLGTTMGGLVMGQVTRTVGFRWSVVGCDSIVLIGWLLLSQVNWAPVWIIRLAHGIGSGGLGLLTPTYIAHVADFRIRGRALVFHQAFVCFGVFNAHAFSAIFTNAELIGVCMVWPALHIFIAVFLPESPLYVYKHHCGSEEVKTAMRRVNGSEVESNYTAMERYVFEFECAIGDNQKRLVRRIVEIGVRLVVLQQTCGASATIFHAKSVIGGFGLTTEVAGYSDERVYINTQTIVTILFAVQVLLCLTTVELVEVLGRKFMLIVSAIGMGACLASLMLYQSVFPTTDVCTASIESNEWHRCVPVILVCLYLCSYSVGWGPVVPLVYAEVVYFDKWFSSLIYAGGQFVLFLVAYAFFDAKALLSYNKYVLGVYIASCVLGVVFVYFCLPETRALPLHRVLQRHTAANNCVDTGNS